MEWPSAHSPPDHEKSLPWKKETGTMCKSISMPQLLQRSGKMSNKESGDHNSHSILRKKMSDEDRYFAERDREILEKHKKVHEKRDMEERKKLHYMKCPKCGADLKEMEFIKDIMIDKCTECSGIWLDKGELRAILKREANLFKSLAKAFFDDADLKDL
jgi:uncharacterized protein